MERQVKIFVILGILMARLNLPSDKSTIHLRCPNHPFRVANAMASDPVVIVRIQGNRSLYGFV